MQRSQVQSACNANHPVGVSAVEAALDSSRDSVTSLAALIQELSQRLSPVLSPSGSGGQDECGDKVRAVLCPIGETALEIGRIAESGTELVRDIINRLQV